MAQNQQDARHSINYGTAPVAQTTPWMPDASSAASLSPASGQPGYNPMTAMAAGAMAGGAAGAMAHPANTNSTGTHTQYNTSSHGGSISPSGGFLPYGQPTPGPFATPTLEQQTSYGSSSSQGGKGPMPGAAPADRLMYTANPTQEAYPANLNPTHGGFMPSPGPGTTASGAQMPESDVDRIAARVASMMGGGLPQGAARPVSPSQMQFDAPPPMYNEKH